MNKYVREVELETRIEALAEDQQGTLPQVFAYLEVPDVNSRREPRSRRLKPELFYYESEPMDAPPCAVEVGGRRVGYTVHECQVEESTKHSRGESGYWYRVLKKDFVENLPIKYVVRMSVADVLGEPSDELWFKQYGTTKNGAMYYARIGGR